MFWPNIIELKHFYSTVLGQVVCRRLRNGMLKFWPELKGETILGVGYAMPFLRCYRSLNSPSSNNTIALMPPGIGIAAWPEGEPNRTILAQEDEIPLPENSIQRILIVHALEYSDSAAEMLNECWRILAPGGKLLLIVPHRMGLWARIEKTPFGHGHPFNLSQVKQLMQKTRFVPTHSETALFFPPTASRLILRSAPVWERLGARFASMLGGVLMVEAEKQMYAFVAEEVSQRKKRRIYMASPEPVMSMEKK